MKKIKTFKQFLNEEEHDKDITRNYGSKLKDINRYDEFGGDEATIEFRFRNNVGVKIFVKGEAYDIYIDGDFMDDDTTKRATSKYKGKTLKSVYDAYNIIDFEFTDGSKCSVSLSLLNATYSLDRI
jgi:vancomycin resistance protein YoaR